MNLKKMVKANLEEPEPFDIQRVYHRDLASLEPLSDEDQLRYLRMVREGDVYARNYFVEHNLRLVFEVARYYTGRGLSFMELISEGNFGLLKAAKRYDESKGCKFSTYAATVIGSEMDLAIKQRRRHERLSTWRELKGSYSVLRHLGESLDEVVSVDEVADMLAIDRDTVNRVLREENGIRPQDSFEQDYPKLHCKHTETPEEYICRRELEAMVSDGLSNLSERERNFLW